MPHLALIVVLIVAVPEETYQARVVGIADGDTITVLRDREQIRVRLHGIDAPESGQDFGTRSRQYAADLAFSKTVTVRPLDVDRYGRVVAEIVLPDGRTLNHELVRAGPSGSGVAFRPVRPERQDPVCDRGFSTKDKDRSLVDA